MYECKSEPCCKCCNMVSVLGYLGKAEGWALISDGLVYWTREAGAVSEGVQISVMIWACQQLKKHCPAFICWNNIREAEYQVLFIAVDIHLQYSGDLAM